MADKPKPTIGENQRQTEVTIFLFIVAFLSIFYFRLEDIVAYWGAGSLESIWARLVAYFLSHIWPWLKTFSLILGAVAIWGIYYCFTKLRAIHKEEQQIYGKDYPYIIDLIEGEKVLPKNGKWEKVITHLNSTNPAEWRQAIIEADIMLEELLRVSGYHGDSVGEMLKSVEPSDFLSLDYAWNAHKVRNRIAHDGSNFELNEREAKATIAEFEVVFKEFKII
ncbi:MAG: hypothetical protein ACYC1K_00420 [Minisyncoccota bacterium]